MTALSHEDLDKLLALAGKATPVEPRDLMSYEHGGGRLAIIRDGKRDLIADFYGDGADRDFYAAANPSALAALVQEVLSLREAGWQPIETLKAQPLEVQKRGVIIACFDPADPFDDGTIGPQYVEWGNGPHGDRWFNFNSHNYGTWKPAPTHWRHCPSIPSPPSIDKEMRDDA